MTEDIVKLSKFEQNIEKHRRQILQEIRIEISTVEKAIERDNTAIDRFIKLKNSEEVKKKEAEIERKQESLLSLKTKENQFKTCEIKLIENKKKVEPKKTQNQIILEEAEEKAERLEKAEKDRLERSEKEPNVQKEYSYYYKQFLKAIETLPEYIQENIENMPNNKGYIWRGVWFQGKMKAEKNQPISMFEKLKGKTHIHVVDKNEYVIYEKIGQAEKTLVSKRTRNPIANSFEVKEDTLPSAVPKYYDNKKWDKRENKPEPKRLLPLNKSQKITQGQPKGQPKMLLGTQEKKDQGRNQTLGNLGKSKQTQGRNQTQSGSQQKSGQNQSQKKPQQQRNNKPKRI